MTQVEHAYQYSVEVRSRFSLLLEDNKPKIKTVPSASPADAPKPKPSSVAPLAPVPPPKTITLEKVVEKSEEITTSPPSRGQRGFHRGTVRPITAIEETTDEQPNRFPRTRPFRGSGPFRGERGRARGYYNQDSGRPLPDVDIKEDNKLADDERTRGRGRLGRGRPRPYGDHRDFDRHSGSDRTGIKPIIKRQGYGQGNWGTDRDELDATLEPAEEPKSDNNDENVITSEEEKPEEKEEPPKALTLGEYKAMQKANKHPVTIVAKNARKPNDGKDVFKNMVSHQKITKESEDEVETSEIPYKIQDDLSFINFTYAGNNMRGRDIAGRPRGQNRGARGEGRGYSQGLRGDNKAGRFQRGARGNRGESSRPPEQAVKTPQLDYDQDFPTLG